MANMEELFANLLEQNKGLVEACRGMLSQTGCHSCCMGVSHDVCDDLQEIVEDDDVQGYYRDTVMQAISEIKELRSRLLKQV